MDPSQPETNPRDIIAEAAVLAFFLFLYVSVNILLLPVNILSFFYDYATKKRKSKSTTPTYDGLYGDLALSQKEKLYAFFRENARGLPDKMVHELAGNMVFLVINGQCWDLGNYGLSNANLIVARRPNEKFAMFLLVYGDKGEVLIMVEGEECDLRNVMHGFYNVVAREVQISLRNVKASNQRRPFSPPWLGSEQWYAKMKEREGTWF
ncbi:hypothetical protein BDW02DRAFT_570856 [Decorospora gaudefroyi]|uniref:Uncharacterized protein n=1 Tax=Decorospora gaudefroyi TaxID=184978 RepID=A0A6A5KH01_9PLEO|nr:hypothetical protein BDW02DRAFT_570856 [Decorospora gaudefroyi]